MTIADGFRTLPSWLAPKWIAEVTLIPIHVESTFEPFGQNPVTNEFNAGKSNHHQAVLTTMKLEAEDADRLISILNDAGTLSKWAFQDPLFLAPGADGFRNAQSNGAVKGASQTGYALKCDSFDGGETVVRQGQFFNVGQAYVQATETVVATNGETNEFLRSQEFDNASWVKPGGATVSADTSEVADPFRNANADKITAANAASGGILRQSIAAHGHGSAYTVSVYAKRGNHDYIGFRLPDDLGTDGAGTYTMFNFSTRTWTAQNGNGTVTGTATELRNGWWRLEVTGTTPGVHANDTVDIALVNSAGLATWTPAGTEYVYLFGAQFQTGSSATTYIETTTVAVTSTGECTLQFWPVLRSSPADNEVVDINDPHFHGQLLSIPERDSRRARTTRPISLAFAEVI